MNEIQKMSGLLNPLKVFKGSQGKEGRTAGKEGRMQFSVEPFAGDSGFTQWHDAMKMCARLPGGIPQEFRRRMWLTLAEQHVRRKSINWKQVEFNSFRDFVSPNDEGIGDQIDKDLHRTGCSLFCGEHAEVNRALLKKVLLGYARWNRNVGYCQGFNMLAAIIIEVMDRQEADALKVMIYLIEGVLPESYFANNLRGLSVDMAVLRELLRLHLPKLSRHLDALQNEATDQVTGTCSEPPLTNVFTMQWFLTLFTNCLPRDLVMRVWDLTFLQGNEILLRTALAIWSTFARQLLEVPTADEFYCVMGILTREMLTHGLMDANQLVQTLIGMAPFPFPGLAALRDKLSGTVTTPWTVYAMAKRGMKILYFQDDDDDVNENMAATGLVAILKKTSGHLAPSSQDGRNSPIVGNRHHLDISALKLQYSRLKERQRQARVIVTASNIRRKSIEEVHKLQTFQKKNPLLPGKGTSKQNRGGPLGVIPKKKLELKKSGPECKAPPTLPPTESEGMKSQPETILWKDTPSRQVGRRASLPIVIQFMESGSNQTKAKDAGDDDDERGSTSTELCDEDLLADLSEEDTLQVEATERPMSTSPRLEHTRITDLLEEKSQSLNRDETSLGVAPWEKMPIYKGFPIPPNSPNGTSFDRFHSSPTKWKWSFSEIENPDFLEPLSPILTLHNFDELSTLTDTSNPFIIPPSEVASDKPPSEAASDIPPSEVASDKPINDKKLEEDEALESGDNIRCFNSIYFSSSRFAYLFEITDVVKLSETGNDTEFPSQNANEISLTENLNTEHNKPNKYSSTTMADIEKSGLQTCGGSTKIISVTDSETLEQNVGVYGKMLFDLIVSKPSKECTSEIHSKDNNSREQTESKVEASRAMDKIITVETTQNQEVECGSRVFQHYDTATEEMGECGTVKNESNNNLCTLIKNNISSLSENNLSLDDDPQNRPHYLVDSLTVLTPTCNKRPHKSKSLEYCSSPEYDSLKSETSLWLQNDKENIVKPSSMESETREDCKANLLLDNLSDYECMTDENICELIRKRLWAGITGNPPTDNPPLPTIEATNNNQQAENNRKANNSHPSEKTFSKRKSDDALQLMKENTNIIERILNQRHEDNKQQEPEKTSSNELPQPHTQHDAHSTHSYHSNECRTVTSNNENSQDHFGLSPQNEKTMSGGTKGKLSPQKHASLSETSETNSIKEEDASSGCPLVLTSKYFSTVLLPITGNSSFNGTECAKQFTDNNQHSSYKSSRIVPFSKLSMLSPKSKQTATKSRKANDSSMLLPGRPSKFNPFPTQPLNRQPKEVGVRLGLYSPTNINKH